MKKAISILLAVLLLSSAILVPAALADNSVTNPEIKAASLSVHQDTCINFIVFPGSAEISKVKLLYFTSPQTEYTEGNATYIGNTCTKCTGEYEGCYRFQYNKLYARDMGEMIYVVAQAEVDGELYYSSLINYSVLTYVNSARENTTLNADTTLMNLLDKMVEYGAAAQKYAAQEYGYSLAEHPLISAGICKLTVVNGEISDGCTTGVYAKGKTVTVTAPATKGNEVFDHWENASGANLSTDNPYSFQLDASMVLTAVYAKVPSEGLAFTTSKKTGNATLAGIGNCEDADVVVPKTYNSYPVVAIAAEAFYGETGITSITIPTSITSIGDSAFDGCTNLTDIYYLGTTTEWNNITIGEDAIPSTATIHCDDPLVTQYTITFKDYDGAVLKTESVAEGSDATPPENPTREGYTFAKWIGNYSAVSGDRTITASYYEGTGSAFIIGDAYLDEDATTVSVPVYISIKEGITTAKIIVDFDDSLSLTGITTSSDFAGIVGAQTYPATDNVTLNWYNGTSNITGDYTFVTLDFDCSAMSGDVAELSLSYDPDDVCNTAQENVSFAVVSGTIAK